MWWGGGGWFHISSTAQTAQLSRVAVRSHTDLEVLLEHFLVRQVSLTRHTLQVKRVGVVVIVADPQVCTHTCRPVTAQNHLDVQVLHCAQVFGYRRRELVHR